MKNSMDFPQKFKDRTTLWPRDSTSEYFSKETQNTNLKKYVYPFVYCL